MGWGALVSGPGTNGETITLLLKQYANGDAEAFSHLVPLIYDDLRKIARHQLRRLRPGRTLDTTGLVHEAYVRLVGKRHAGFAGRGHFFAVAATAMRQILIDHARYLARDKRRDAALAIPLDEGRAETLDVDAHALIDLDMALTKLADSQPRVVQVVECRYFAGLTADETATALGVALRTVHRDWLKGKAWLRNELRGAQDAMDDGTE